MEGMYQKCDNCGESRFDTKDFLPGKLVTRTGVLNEKTRQLCCKCVDVCDKALYDVTAPGRARAAAMLQAQQQAANQSASTEKK